jgi:hypothetical protein
MSKTTTTCNVNKLTEGFLLESDGKTAAIIDVTEINKRVLGYLNTVLDELEKASTRRLRIRIEYELTQL